jgi:hypothetical protein
MARRLILQNPIAEACPLACPSQCENVFDRVHVSWLIAGGTRVFWDLLPEFHDPLPYAFQLQRGRTANPDADDWENVGLPVENTFYAIDGEQRVFGKSQWTHYRVMLTTGNGIYYSDPTGLLGVLSARDWKLAREVIRQMRVRNRLDASEGYLCKRRTSGNKCPRCIDLQTQESKDGQCPICFGTTFQCGYYYPMPCIFAALEPKTKRVHVHQGLQRGTIADVVVKGTMINCPLLDSNDVWIDKKTDDRYYIHTIQSIAERRGISILADVELRPAAYSDVIYTLEVPEQVAELE